MAEKKSISKRRSIKRILLWFFAVVVLLLLIVAVLLRTSWFQTGVANRAAEYFSKELGTQIRIGKVHLSSFQDAELEAFYVEDLHGDTLFYVERLEVQGAKWSKEDRHLHIDALELSNFRDRLKRYAGEEKTDLAVLLSRLRSEGEKKEFSMSVGRFAIRDHHFSFDDANAEHKEKGLDFKHIAVRQPILLGDSLHFGGDSISLSLDSLVLVEHSGFEVREFSGQLEISPSLIAVEDLRLLLRDSELNGKLSMAQESFADFTQFDQLVYMRSELQDSHLRFSDIAFFAPKMNLGQFGLDLTGRFRGTIADLKGRDVEIRTGRNTYLKGDIDMSGLPDIQNTFMIVDVEEFRSDRTDIASLPIPFIMKDPGKAVPEILGRFGRVGFSGNFTGFASAFTAFGDFSTALGSLSTDMTFKRDSTTGYAVFDGKLSTEGFHLWKAIGDDRPGLLACELDLEAQGSSLKNFKAELDGVVSRLDIGARSFNDIEVHGVLEKNVFNGNLVSNDEDLQFEFDGLADFRGKWPQVDFSAFVYHADLHELGLSRVPAGATLSARITAQGLLAPDSLNGTIDMRDILYCEGDEGEYDFGDAWLSSEKVNGEPFIQLKSTVADASIRGNSIPREIPLVAQQILFSVFPSLDDQREFDFRDQDMSALITFKETHNVLRLLMPDLRIAKGTQLQLDLNSKTLHLDAHLQSSSLAYKQTNITNIDCRFDKTLDVIAFSASADRSAVNDSVYISDIELRGKAYQDDMDLNISWAGSSRGSNGNMSVLANVEGRQKGTVQFLPSQMFFGRGIWEVRDTSVVYIDSSSFRFDKFSIWNEEQLVSLDGLVSKDPSSVLEFDMQHVAIENANLFMKGPDWSGSFNGKGSVTDFYGKTILYTSAHIDSLAIGPDLIGNVDLQGKWNERRKRVDMTGTVSREKIKAIDFSGWYRPEDNNAISLRLEANRFDLGFLDAYIPAGLDDIEGRVSGNIYVDGSLNDLLLNGEVQLDDAAIKVDFLNTTYHFSAPVSIYPDMFATEQFKLLDEEGNGGNAIVQLMHTGLKNFSYDVSVEMDTMLCLNTTVDQSDVFYGKAYGTGDVNVSGYGKLLYIEVNARSEKGTHIVFPLGDGSEVSSFDFVEFVSSDSTASASADISDLLGINMDMNLEVTPDAFIELIFDPTVGDILSGKGEGILELKLLPSGELTLFGGIDVIQGDYLFTLRNLINKRFSLDKGGRVSWFGDPYNAKLDVNTVYKLRAPLFDILYDANDAYKRRVPVEVVMSLSGRMLDPEIGFNVRLPSVDESVRTQVNSVLSTERELNRQVFSLMMLNKFSAPSSGAFASGSFAGATGSELLSNQVSNWLSGISDNLDLGVNYRSGDKTAQDELELAVSTQLFDERLLLNTNVGVSYGDKTGAENNTLIGDFQLEYLLTDDGKLRLKAFSQSNDKNLNQVDQASTTQGVGVRFREDFDSWGQFWRSINGIIRKDPKE